jgi:hypothetical protein
VVAAVVVPLGQGLAGEDVAGREDAFARSISDRPIPPDGDRRVGSRTQVTVVR